MNGDKLQNFIYDFENVFFGFTDEQNKIISYHFYKFKKILIFFRRKKNTD